MQKLKILFPIALFIGIFFVACHEEDPSGSVNVVSVTFAGRIIDENGNAIEGALVKAGDETALSDRNGVFKLKPVLLPPMHAQVTVSKAGYFEVSRPYIVEDQALQTITIQLLQKILVGTIPASSGGTVTVPGGVKLLFPANAVSDANGAAYSGDIHVFAHYIDPSDPALGLKVPGDMTAENAADEEVFLATYGMVGVEIEDPSGNKLKITAGQEVELRMPILIGQSASAPNVIPLWHYDLEEGHWREEGSAQRVGNEYVGKVKHFSFWNCDSSIPLIQMHGTIYIENTNQPLINRWIRITMLSTGASSFGYTDDKGRFGGCIPKDEALKLEIVGPVECGNVSFYSQDIGPFGDVTTLPDIIVPAANQIPVLKVSGLLKSCNGQAITNGYVKLELGDAKYYLFSNAAGAFDYAVVGCGTNAQTGRITGYDLTNLLESNPVAVTIPPKTINVGNITVCNTVDEYIRFTLDGGQESVSIAPIGWMNVNTATISDSIHISLSFVNNGQTGTFPISSMQVNQLYFDPQAANTLSTTMSSSGANVGDLMIGNFNGNFLDDNGANHSITGSYRVKRSW